MQIKPYKYKFADARLLHGTTMKWTQCYFIDRHDETLFFPWAFMLTVGACWAVFLPPNANPKLLHAVVRWFCVAVVALPLSAIVIAKLLGFSAAHLMAGTWLAVVLLYSAAVACPTAGWRRAPLLDAIQYRYPVRDDRTDSLLLQQVLFGLITVSIFLALRVTDPFAIAFCVLFLVNSAMAAIALYRRSRKST